MKRTVKTLMLIVALCVLAAMALSSCTVGTTTPDTTSAVVRLYEEKIAALQAEAEANAKAMAELEADYRLR